MAAAVSSTSLKQMNLATVQRNDKTVVSIKVTSPLVTLYTFDPASKHWAKTETEGSLFVCERSSSPKYMLAILNKKDPTMYSTGITEKFECQMQDKFLIYRDAQGKICSLWFFDEKECSRVFSITDKVVTAIRKKLAQKAARCNDGSTTTPTVPLPLSTSHIFGMLGSQEKQHSSASSTTTETPTTLTPVKGDAIANGSSNVVQNGGSSKNLISMLASAQQRFHEERKCTDATSSPVSSSVKPLQESSDENAPTEKPAAGKSKRQSVKVAVESPPPNNDQTKSETISVAPAPQSGSDTNGGNCSKNDTSVEVLSTISSTAVSPQPPSVDFAINSALALSSTTSSLPLLTPEVLGGSGRSSPTFYRPPAPESLMSPEAFLNSIPPLLYTNGGFYPLDNGRGYNVSESSGGAVSPTAGSSGSSGSLHGSLSAALNDDFANGGSLHQPKIVSREQFRDTLVYLLQTDEDFVTRIHDAFVQRQSSF